MRSKAHVRICGNPGWVTIQGDPANPCVHLIQRCYGLMPPALAHDLCALRMASPLIARAREWRRVSVVSARDMNTTGQAAPHRMPPKRQSAVYMIAFTVRLA